MGIGRLAELRRPICLNSNFPCAQNSSSVPGRVHARLLIRGRDRIVRQPSEHGSAFNQVLQPQPFLLMFWAWGP